jgi:sec-independent protein translocase protein TatA
MLGLGMPELIFILVLALLIFGPKRLPEVGKTLGRGLSEFRRASNELKRSIETELTEEEQRALKLPPPVAIRPAAGTMAVGQTAADTATSAMAEAAPATPAAALQPPAPLEPR